jgi:hypothetical protein
MVFALVTYYGSNGIKISDNGTVGPGGKHPGLALT